MTGLPDGVPTSAEYWYGRWLAAQEQLDEEAAARIAGWPKAAAAERERILNGLRGDTFLARDGLGHEAAAVPWSTILNLLTKGDTT